MVTIAIDAMGSDQGSAPLVKAALNAVNKHSGLSVILVGDQAILQNQLDDLLRRFNTQVIERIRIRHASEVVEGDDTPATALRGKKQSSMRLALSAVADGEADACVSAGNTGALMAISRLVLSTCDGIDRPAIISALPGVNQKTLMLDLGANVDCDSEQLYQFALMGHTLAAALRFTDKPRIALLNIGEEKIKGNDQVKQANELLSADSRLNYVGYVEANDIFADKADVIVCDGFIGNVALKSIEGASTYLLGQLETHLRNMGWKRYLFGWLLRPLLSGFLQQFNPANYNGATFVGLRGIVVKSHGAADHKAFAHAIELALEEVNSQMIHQIMSF